MIHIIGTGGHAAVVRDALALAWGGSMASEDRFIVAIGDNATRKRVACEQTMRPVWALVHPDACVSLTAELGVGTVVMAGAVIQPYAKVGKHCIVNTGATLDHHCIIEDYAHIAPGAHLCGNVHVGEGALVGVGVGIAPGAMIPAWSLVKARRLEIEQSVSGN